MLMLLIHISLAGNGPTAYAIGNAVLHLANHADVLASLAADRAAIPAAVEELLRFDSATHVVARFAIAETKLGARAIRPGETCFAVIAAANRDPARFAEPDTLDLARADNRHLSFGMASHFCLGAPLARMEMAIAINALLDRYGVFGLKSMQRGGTFLLRGPARVTISKG
jgi:cytochrome P450